MGFLTDGWEEAREVEKERDQLRALAGAARDGMRQLGEDLEASRSEVERLRDEIEQKHEINVNLTDERDAATARAEAAEGRADVLYRGLCDAVRASGGVANEGISDSFLTIGVPAEMAARKKAQEAAEALVAGLRGALEELIAAAECIRHWHDTGRNGEGMIVSSAKVHELWAETDKARAALALTPASAVAAIEARVWGEAAEKVSEWADKLMGYERAAVLGCAANLTEIADRLTAEAKEAANG